MRSIVIGSKQEICQPAVILIRRASQHIPGRDVVRGIDTVGSAPGHDLVADTDIETPGIGIDVGLPQRELGDPLVELHAFPKPELSECPAKILQGRSGFQRKFAIAALDLPRILRCGPPGVEGAPQISSQVEGLEDSVFLLGGLFEQALGAQRTGKNQHQAHY